MPFTIIRQDITKMDVDAVVNAADTSLRQGGGVCGAIFKAAGARRLQAACDRLAPIRTGEAVATPGFDLPARLVIHAAGPVWDRQPAAQGDDLLRHAYEASLRLAVRNDCESIAFPLLSSGAYGYPKARALAVARAAITDFLATHDLDVYLAVFDKEAFAASEALVGRVASYIDEHYVEEHADERRRAARRAYDLTSDGSDMDAGLSPNDQAVCWEAGARPATGEQSAPSAPCAAPTAYREPLPLDKATVPASLDELIGNLDEPFNETLTRLIDAKGLDDPQVYKRANISRKLFSKIRCGGGYMPSKRTVIALAIALELTLAQTDDLLRRAGYALSHSQVFDVIVEYFIVSGRYDIFEINEVLFAYDQPLLGSM